jgi:hypothetical protein
MEHVSAYDFRRNFYKYCTFYLQDKGQDFGVHSNTRSALRVSLTPLHLAMPVSPEYLRLNFSSCVSLITYGGAALRVVLRGIGTVYLSRSAEFDDRLIKEWSKYCEDSFKLETPDEHILALA